MARKPRTKPAKISFEPQIPLAQVMMGQPQEMTFTASNSGRGSRLWNTCQVPPFLSHFRQFWDRGGITGGFLGAGKANRWANMSL